MIRLLAKMAWRGLHGWAHDAWMRLRFDYAMVSDAVDQARAEQRRGR